VVELGASADEQLLRALARSAPFLRSRLAEMVNLRYSPKLFFAVDTSFEAAQRIEQVLREPEVARDLQHDDEGTREDDDSPA
jgi:ribosome-binding factor A